MNIVNLEFKQRKKSFIIWLASCIFLIILFMLLHQAMISGQIERPIFFKIINITKILGFTSISSDNIQFDTYFIYFYQYIFLIQCIFCTLLGADILRKEETSNTIQYLYSMPISRAKIYFSKFISALLLSTMFIVVIWVVLFCLIALLQPSSIATLLLNRKILLIVFYTYLTAVAYLTLGLFISLLFKISTSSVIIGGILFLITYIIGFSSELEYLSFYKYIDPGHFLYHFNELKAILLISAIIIFFIAGMILYKKRDFKIN
jgi:ABC-2 type transport system permease protein